MKVVEVLGIDATDGLPIPHLDEVIDCRGGGVGRVVPTSEGDDEHRAAQLLDVFELDHSRSLRKRGAVMEREHGQKSVLGTT